MLIDFNTMEEQVLPHFKNGEGAFLAKIREDELGKIILGRLEPGSTIGLHTHDVSSEVFYFLSGEGKVLYDGEYEAVSAGSCHYCPKGHSHSLINDGQKILEFLAVVPLQ